MFVDGGLGIKLVEKMDGQCDTCGQMFHYVREYREHMRTAHKKSRTGQWNPEDFSHLQT
jgi:uncharacterized C2H2 Zn-finger protein